MLREGLNHADRIPYHSRAEAAATDNTSKSWARHIKAHYKKLPDYLVFTRDGLSDGSSLFGDGGLPKAIRDGDDFGMWGTKEVELPRAQRADFCAQVLTWEKAGVGGRRAQVRPCSRPYCSPLPSRSTPSLSTRCTT